MSFTGLNTGAEPSELLVNGVSCSSESTRQKLREERV